MQGESQSYSKGIESFRNQEKPKFQELVMEAVRRNGLSLRHAASAVRCDRSLGLPKNKKHKQQGGGEQFEDVGWKSASVDDGWMVPGWVMQCLDHV